MTTPPPCVGQHALFDATDPWSHHAAAELCAACPLIDACADRLAEVQADGGAYGQPEGTWAGELFLDNRSRSEERKRAREARRARIAFEESLYTDDDAKRAHADYTLGDRSQWARVGHRVYGRRAKRAQRELGVAS